MAAGFAVGHWWSGNDPVCQGRRLSAWLDQYDENHWKAHGNRELEAQASNAIREVGTKAIPRYLGMITTHDSALHRRMRSLLPQRLFALLPGRDANQIRFRGASGLIALGAGATPALPSLASILRSQDGSDRLLALMVLRQLDPVAVDSLPFIADRLKDPDFGIKSYALRSLGEMRRQPDRTVSVLIGYLDSTAGRRGSDPLRGTALWALRQFGADAKPAIPTLIRLWEEGDNVLRPFIEHTLIQIDPQFFFHSTLPPG